MKKIQMTLITALAFVMMCSASWAATYYIDGTNGDDTKSGSQSAPWKTIGKANSTLKAGDTVYIKKGTYKQTIRPSRSGEKGSYITYARYGSEDVVIRDVYDGVNLEDRSYVVIDGLRIEAVSNYWVNMRDGSKSTYNIIKNCIMKNAGGYGGVYLKTGANYNKLQNNIFISTCPSGPNDLVVSRGNHHNLFEGNEFRYGHHMGLDIAAGGSHHIVRNNTIYNPWHTGLALGSDLEHCLIENNKVLDCGDDYKNNSCGTDRDRSMARYQQKGLQMSASNNIIRNNVFSNNGSLAITTYLDKPKKCYNNRFYNNTFYKDYRAFQSSTGRNDGNIIKNNIIYKSIEYAIDLKYDQKIYIINNNISGGKISYGSISNSDLWRDNIESNPLFINESIRNFQLQPESPMRDAGTWLTTITSSNGSGTSFIVNDSRYFMDGWGIIKGDMIQLQGSKKTARITNIDYNTNTITVNIELSWNKGTGVSLPYNDEAPDMGAYEYEGDQTSDMLNAPTNLKVSQIY